jgi:hypothetical protein
MAQPKGEARFDALRPDFDRCLKLEFHDLSVTSDAGLLTDREFDDSLGLMAVAGQHLVDSRRGRNGRHDFVVMLRQSVSGRLAGYDDANDADRLARDPFLRWIVGGKAIKREAGSTILMGRFEIERIDGLRRRSAPTPVLTQQMHYRHGRRASESQVDRLNGWIGRDFGRWTRGRYGRTIDYLCRLTRKRPECQDSNCPKGSSGKCRLKPS